MRCRKDACGAGRMHAVWRECVHAAVQCRPSLCGTKHARTHLHALRMQLPAWRARCSIHSRCPPGCGHVPQQAPAVQKIQYTAVHWHADHSMIRPTQWMNLRNRCMCGHGTWPSSNRCPCMQPVVHVRGRAFTHHACMHMLGLAGAQRLVFSGSLESAIFSITYISALAGMS